MQQLISLSLFLTFFSFNVFAEANFDAPIPSGKVIIGAYVNGIHSIDLKAGTVDMDLYVWFRTKGERNILDSIEVMNGSISEKSSVVKKKFGDENYYSMRIAVKIYQKFNLLKFPLDTQNLSVIFEDSEEDNLALQFVPDTKNTKVSSVVILPGWKIGNANVAVNSNSYDTNYGDLSIGNGGSSFSRATVSIPIDRDGIGYFFKLFGTIALAAAVAFLSFFIQPDDLDPRFGLGVGGIFAAVASNLVLSSMLPETPQVTMGEAILLVTILAIFITLLESVYSLKLWRAGKQASALKIDLIAGWIVPITYLFICTVIILAY